MSEVKIVVDGKDVIVRDVDIEDGFATLKFGEYETKIPVEDWEEAV